MSIVINDLTFSYQPKEKEAAPLFEGLNFTVNQGELLAILGPSGCGKSSLIKLMAGFLTPLEGTILFNGQAVEKPYGEGQMVFQDSHQLYPWLSIRDNISFPNKGKKGDSQKVDSLLAAVGLENRADFFPGELSGGMRQRCALARALYYNPKLIFMDEPFVSLDAPSRHRLQDLVRDLWKEWGITVIFVTHDIEEALYLSDRILLMKDRGGIALSQDNPLSLPRDRWGEMFLKEVSRFHSLVESVGESW
ncbi:MAG: ABC transporter ATP-binding protein [Spirochaetales bacterium]|nr:ABC transporter ATP-binding protein [Spirochaetales bacterium]